MPDAVAPVEIPNRALFKAAEVCEITHVQPYVLRSWETEFPALGVAKSAGGPRVYRRSDVEQVVRIRHLLLVEGLTLAGVRRKLEDEATPIAADEPAIEELLGRNARERLTTVKRGLRSILALLDGAGIGAPSNGRQVMASVTKAAATVRSKPPARSKPAARAKNARPSGSRRKRA